MAELAGATPRLIQCGEDVNFKLTASNLEKNITSKTKVFLFCSPSNPTGFIYTEKELKEIADVLKKHPQVCVITDDMYNRLMFGKTKVAPHILQVAPELRERTVVINGGSKAYSMTGWRIGWVMAPEKVAKAIGDYASQSTGAPSSIAQAAAEKALLTSESDILHTNVMLKERLMSAMKKFNEVPQFKVYEPDGAFYLWVNIKGALGKKHKGEIVNSSHQFGKILLEEYFVATVPGEEFGEPGFMRLSFAIDSARFNQAVDRMKTFIASMV